VSADVWVVGMDRFIVVIGVVVGGKRKRKKGQLKLQYALTNTRSHGDQRRCLVGNDLRTFCFLLVVEGKCIRVILILCMWAVQRVCNEV